MGIDYTITTGVFCEVPVLCTPPRYEQKKQFCPNTGEELEPRRERAGGELEYIRMDGDQAYSEMGHMSEDDFLIASEEGAHGDVHFAEAIYQLFEDQDIVPHVQWNSWGGGKTRLLLAPPVELLHHEENDDVRYMHGQAEELLLKCQAVREAAVAMGIKDVSAPIVTAIVSVH